MLDVSVFTHVGIAICSIQWGNGIMSLKTRQAFLFWCVLGYIHTCFIFQHNLEGSPFCFLILNLKICTVKNVLELTAWVNLQIYTPMWSPFRLRPRVIFSTVGRPFQSGRSVSSSSEKFSCIVSLVISPLYFLRSFFLKLFVHVGYPMWILCWSFLFCILTVPFSFNFLLFYQISLFQLCFSFPGALSCSLFFTSSSFTSLTILILGFFLPRHYPFPFFSFDCIGPCLSGFLWWPILTWLSVTVKEWSVYMCDGGLLWKEVVWEPDPFFGGCPDVTISWVLCYLFAFVLFLGWSFSPEKNPFVTVRRLYRSAVGEEAWGSHIPLPALFWAQLLIFPHCSAVCPRPGLLWSSLSEAHHPPPPPGWRRGGSVGCV